MEHTQLNEVFEKVKTVISQSCGLDKEIIKLDTTLFDELGIDSIDFVDILFMLETAYGITLKVGEIERESRKELGEKQFAINNIITPEGLEMLRKKMQEVPAEKLKEGMAVHEIVNLVTVHSLCKMIIVKIEQKELIKIAK